MDANAPVVLPAVASRDLIQGKNEWRNIQEVVRTALSALYEAASYQSDRIAKLELDVKQKANREDVNVALAQKASAFDVASRLKQLQNLVTAKADEGAMDEQREGMEAALQASTSSLGSLLDTKADSSQIKSWLEQVDDRISLVEESQIRAEQAAAQRLTGLHAELDARLAALRADVGARLAKEMGQIEFNCSAAMGEMVSAGIEQISASSAGAGEATRAIVEELKQQLLADMAALKAEATQLTTKTLTKLNAAMEQSRSLKAWREQQNLRILEMQAALTGLDNRHKAAAARAERALEAATRELRAEAAAAQKAEARRLEAMLEHSTSLLRQTSVLGLATARATSVNDLESLREEMEELKAEALSSPAGSMRVPSPTEFQAFQSRLHRAGYETAHELREKEEQGATGSTLSPQSEQALDQPKVSMRRTHTKMSSLEGTEGTCCALESVPAVGSKQQEHTAILDMPSEQGHPETSSLCDAAAMPGDTGTDESGEEQRQNFEEREEKPDGAKLSESPLWASYRADSNEPALSLSEHAASVSSVMCGIEGNADAPEAVAEPTTDAEITITSATVTSAGSDDDPAQSALDTLVDRVIDSELAEAPDREYGLTWPGLSDGDLAEPEKAPEPAEPGFNLLRPSAAEDESAPRAVDARCMATMGQNQNQSAREHQQSGQDANTGYSTAEGQQGDQHCNAVPTEAAVVTAQEGPTSVEQLSESSSADVRRRCDEALFGTAEGPIDHAHAPLLHMRTFLPENAINDSVMHVDCEKAVLSSKVRSSAAAAPDDGWAIPAECSLAELQRMRAAMLAMQLATAQQASTSASLQERVRDLEELLRLEIASLHSPSGLRTPVSDIHQHWHAAVAAGSNLERSPYRCGNMPVMRQVYGPSATSDAAARKVDAQSSYAAAVLEPLLAILHGQKNMLQQHLLPLSRHMAHMQATTAALHHRMDQLQVLGG